MSVESAIRDGVAHLQLALPDGGASKLAAHVALVEKWNRVHNLTAVRDVDQMVSLHVLDSLSVLPHLGEARSILDVGSGAGFPGIVIAIADPARKVTLLDSSHKKCAFLEQAKAELGLTNVSVACERVQAFQPDGKFDAVVSRAFAELHDFVSQAGHLVAPEGWLLAMKGVYPYEEIGRLPATHRVSGVEELHVPSLDAKRHVVRIEAA
jgi:16S rRNA (guanine527-N7)-methyltransferase